MTRNQIVFLFFIWVFSPYGVEFLSCFGYLIPYLSAHGFSLHLVPFSVQLLVWYNPTYWSTFGLVASSLGVLSEKPLSRPMLQGFFTPFFHWQCSKFTFFIHCELFVNTMWNKDTVSFFHIWIQIFATWFIGEFVPFLVVYSCHLCWNSIDNKQLGSFPCSSVGLFIYF